MRVGAIDMGTNSTRLLIADVDGGQVATLDRRMRITRLGQGVDASRRLADAAIERTVEALGEYRRALDDLGVERVRAVATSAARDASNADDLLAAIARTLGTRGEILTGADEARLSFDGATAGVDEPAPFLVVDIGGGSTELVVGTTMPEGEVSLDVGCVRVTEQFLHSDPPSAEELSQAVQVVRLHLTDADMALPSAHEAKTLIGLAGTVSTVAAIELGLEEYDRGRIHHFRLTRSAAEEVFRTLATEAADQRRHNPGLEPGRVDVIVGGAIVLVAVMRHYDRDEMLVSEADILDGLARSMAS
ncbi:MAG TPA: Ppx/GppA phosphatase family protein [Acidimicrobiia bacterium]|nr:Ppx/GppA phosphatase family protein [Acidimicrobiia bacterium]